LHRPRVIDGGLDFGAVADDRAVLDQPVDIPTSHCCDLGGIELMERPSECIPLAEHDRPAEADLEDAQRQRLEHRRLVVRASAPYVVVIAAKRGISGPGPWTPRPSVVPGDHVCAQAKPIALLTLLL